MESGDKERSEMTVKMFLNTSEYLQFLLSELSCVPPNEIPQSVKQVTLDLMNSVQTMMKNLEVSRAASEQSVVYPGQHPYHLLNPGAPPRQPYSQPFSPMVNNHPYYMVPTYQPQSFQNVHLNHPYPNGQLNAPTRHDVPLHLNVYNPRFPIGPGDPSPRPTGKSISPNPIPPLSYARSNSSNSTSPHPSFPNSQSNASSSLNPTPRSTPPPHPSFPNSQSNASSSLNPTPRSMTPQSNANSRRGSTSSNCSMVSNASSSNPQINKFRGKQKTPRKNTYKYSAKGEAPKREETQPATSVAPATLDTSDPYYKFKSLLNQMGSYFKKNGTKLPAMFCFVCSSSFDSYFDWIEHIELPDHEISDYAQRSCNTCHLEIYALSRDIISFLQFPEHKEVDLLYSGKD